MWAAAVILEYSFSPALADIASASSENARAACMVALQVVGETEQAEAGDQGWPETGRPASFNSLPECGLAVLFVAEPEQGGTEPGVGDTVPGRCLFGAEKCGLTGRSAGSEVAEQPGVHGAEAVRRGGAGAEPVVKRATGGCAGSLVDPSPDFIQPAGGDGHQSAGHTQPGVAVVGGGRQQLEPGSYCFMLTRGGEPEPRCSDELARFLDLLGCHQVRDRVRNQPAVTQPGRRAPVGGRRGRWIGAEQLVPQQLAEQVVVAVPLAAVVERDQERVRPLDVSQHRRRASTVDHLVAQRSAEPVQDRRRQHEGTGLRRLAGKNLRGQIVNDVAVISGERVDEFVGVVSAASDNAAR